MNERDIRYLGSSETQIDTYECLVPGLETQQLSGDSCETLTDRRNQLAALSERRAYCTV